MQLSYVAYVFIGTSQQPPRLLLSTPSHGLLKHPSRGLWRVSPRRCPVCHWCWSQLDWCHLCEVQTSSHQRTGPKRGTRDFVRVLEGDRGTWICPVFSSLCFWDMIFLGWGKCFLLFFWDFQMFVVHWWLSYPMLRGSNNANACMTSCIVCL